MGIISAFKAPLLFETKLQIFDKIDHNIFVAGCYNGSGIGVGTLFGEQIAIKASEGNTKEIEIIETISRRIMVGIS